MLIQGVFRRADRAGGTRERANARPDKQMSHSAHSAGARPMGRAVHGHRVRLIVGALAASGARGLPVARIVGTVPADRVGACDRTAPVRGTRSGQARGEVLLRQQLAAAHCACDRRVVHEVTWRR